MASRTRLSLRLRCHGFKGRALKFHSRGGEPGDEATRVAPVPEWLKPAQLASVYITFLAPT